jgi:two-component system, chemotaxis family, sensor kinase CheA
VTATSDSRLGDFLAEAQEIVDAFAGELLHIDRARAGGDDAPDRVNECFRAVHSLKGLAGLAGRDRLTSVAHTLETLLDQLRLGRVPLADEVMDALHESVAVLGAALAAAAAGGDLDRASEAAFAVRLAGLVQGAPAVDAPPAADPLADIALPLALREVLTEFEEHRARENARRGRRLYAVGRSFELATIDRGLADLEQALRPLGEVIATVPGDDAGDLDRLHLSLLLGTDAGLEAVEAAAEGAEVIAFEAGAAPPAPAGAPRLPPPAPIAAAAEEAEVSIRSVSRSVRVDIRRLDALMNTLGELALVHAELTELSERAGSGPDGRELHRVTRALERRIAELQGGLLEVRMVPLRQIFDKLERVVRKVSRRIGKQVDLAIGGADTELDKVLVEELSDPLLHVIRNAIDHGIEEPAERRAAGKPEIGTISVQALQQGNRVVIEVRDDGRGIDHAAVAEAAVRRGLIGADEAAAMDRRALLGLLFLPGMSTRQQATELSGRGVGLDVVKTNIGNLSGTLELGSTPGAGSVVTITVPVTLAIVSALVVAVAGQTYAIPLTGVLESLMVPATEVGTVRGREVVSIRSRTVPLARLERLFRLSRDPGDPGPERLSVVILGVAERRLALVVDQLIGQQDIVIKSLGRLLARVRGVAGGAELGGRRTVLVLDVPALVEEALGRGPEAKGR